MEFEQIVVNVVDFFQDHLLISLALLVVLAYFFYQEPKETFKFLVFLGIMAIAGCFILQLGNSTDTGINAKKELSNKTKKALGE